MKIFFVFFLIIGVFIQKTPLFKGHDSIKKNLSDSYSDSALADYYIKEGYKLKGNSPKISFDLAIKALKLSEQNKDVKLYIDAQNLIGSIKNDLGEFENALDCHLKALEKAQQIKDNVHISTTLNYIGTVYFSQNQIAQAIDYYNQSLKYAENAQTNNQILNNLYKLGLIYESLNKYQEAYKYYKRSLLIEEETKNKEGMFYSLIGIGSVSAKRHNYYQAYVIYNRALDIATELQVLAYVSLCYSHLGDLQRDQKEYVKARDFYLKALAIADSLEFKKDRRDCYLNLAQTNENLQFYNDAYFYLARFVEVNDTLFTQESNDRKMRMQIKFDLRAKEKEIDILKQKDQQGIMIRNFLVAGFILISLVAFLFFYLNRVKQRSNRLLNARNLEIEQQREEISTNLEQLAFVNSELSKKNQQITDSIVYARSIQEAILPQSAVFKGFFPESFVFFRPRDIVSGDFYWLHTRKDKVYIALADCTGHGVAGAFMSMMGYTLLNSVVDENIRLSPAKILGQLNQKIIAVMRQHEGRETSHDDGMDITICAYDMINKTIEFASANQSIALVQNGKIEVLSGDISSIGGTFAMKDEHGFTNHQINFESPTTIYLYSDGFQDQFGGKNNQKFMQHKFISTLQTISAYSMKEQYQMLTDVFEEWKGEGKQTDDILVIGLQF